jgi:GntR family transcriptional regulator, trigonelline degradation regulator
MLKVERIRTSLSDMTLETLRNAIINLELKPGERLIERKLCEQTGVSRTCIREALRSLEADGLVSNIPYVGQVVTVLSPREVGEIYEARCALEGQICELAAKRADDNIISQLEQAVTDLGKATEKRALKAALEANQRFYETMLSGAGNTVLAELSRKLWARASYIRATMISRGSRKLSMESIARMEKVVDAIRKRNHEQARKMIVEHIQASSEVALQIAAEITTDEPIA